MKLKIYFAIFIFLVSISVAMSCLPSWHQDSVICRTNNTYIKTFTDMNSCNSLNPPYGNGTEDYCNYCYEDLQMTSSACVGGKQNNSWADLNYYSCCAITNLDTDCSILVSPFNTTTTPDCYWGNLTSDMGNLTCQVQPHIGLNDKEYCVAHIPLQYSNESFKCIAIITNGETGEIIQTTPEYKEVTPSPLNQIFNLYEVDTREFFTPANNIVNVYYTGKNLHPDTNYILGIQCASEYRKLTSEMRFDMTYGDVSFVFFRTEWLMANAPYIIGGIILLIILLGILWVIIKGVF